MSASRAPVSRYLILVMQPRRRRACMPGGGRSASEGRRCREGEVMGAMCHWAEVRVCFWLNEGCQKEKGDVYHLQHVTAAQDIRGGVVVTRDKEVASLS